MRKRDKKEPNTLDTYHKKYMNVFQSEKKELSKLKKQLKNLVKENDKLNKKSFKECSDLEIDRKLQIKNEIEEIELNIMNIENKKQESDYYIKTMDILSSYYTEQEKKEEVKEKKSNSIMDFLKNKNKEDKSLSDLSGFIKKETKIDKKSLFHDYLSQLDQDIQTTKVDYVQNYAYCDECQQEKVLIQTEALYVCYSCGDCNTTIIESEKPSYKEPIAEVCNFSYKRYNHYCEWLNKFQALESTTIPQEVYDLIMVEIKKQKIRDLKLIDAEKMRNILKKIDRTKYYEHVFHIINKINGAPPPKLHKELEEKMRIMFKKTQDPFSKICPDDRTNFLSYSYVIRKFLELLGQTQYIKYFPLLKSREKLYQQDMMWKAICKQLNWKFIPSI
jgi:hypothetical protein